MRQLKITKSITNRESASLDKYLQEIGREELVSPEEEVELAQRIRKGDEVALEKLTRANLRFVVSVAVDQSAGTLDGERSPDVCREREELGVDADACQHIE